MKEFAIKQLWVCNIKNSAPNCHLLIWQTLPAVTTKEPKTHLLTRCMHLGLLRISNNGFGGRSKTGEHKEKSLRQKRWTKKKKVCICVMMAYNIFHSGLFGISNCGFGGRTITEEPQEKSSRQKREYTSTMMV